MRPNAPLSSLLFFLAFLNTGIVQICQASTSESSLMTNSWVGGASGDWDVPANWSLGHVPLNSEDIAIGNGATVTIPVGYSAVARTVLVSFLGSLTINTGATLELTSSSAGLDRLENRGILTNDGNIIVENLQSGETGIKNASFYAQFSNNGTITVSDYEGSLSAGIENQSSAEFINSVTGIIIIRHAIGSSAGPALKNQTSAIFQNFGMIEMRDILSGISNFTSAQFENSGTLQVFNCKAHEGINNNATCMFTNLAGGNIIMDTLNAAPGIQGIYNRAKFNNYGSINIQRTSGEGIENRTSGRFKNEGNIQLANVGGTEGITNTSAGYFSGTGSITSDQPFEQGAIFATGSDVATLTINGDFFHTSNSIDTLDVHGHAGGGDSLGHDSIFVSGDLHLEGLLLVPYNFNFDPYPAAEFVLFAYGGVLTGNYDSISLPGYLSHFALDLSNPGQVILRDTNCVLATNKWTGGMNDDWNEPANWSLGHVPTACEWAVIQNDSVVITNATHSARSILLSNAVLNLNNNTSVLTIDGNALDDQGIEMIAGSRLYVNGTLNIRRFQGSAAYGIWINDGFVENSGSINIRDLDGAFAYGIYVDETSEFVSTELSDVVISNLNAPAIRISPGATFTNGDDVRTVDILASPAIFNLGYLFNYSGSRIEVDNISGAGISSTGTIENLGVIDISNCNGWGMDLGVNAALINDHSIYIENTTSASITNFSTATVYGNGEIDVDNGFLQHARMNPGRSPGILTVDGNLSHDPASIDTFEIAGAADPGDSLGFDLVQVEGDLVLDGKLVVKLLNGFVPADDQSFRLFTYTGALSGAFSSIELPPSMAGWFLDFTFPGRIILRKIPCDYGVNTFLGGNKKWHKASNWSLGHIPLPCEEVVINPGDTVLITSGNTAEALTVLVDSAFMHIEVNASLIMDLDHYEQHGLWIKSGYVENLGEIHIKDTYREDAVHCNDGSHFENYGLISVQDYEGSGSYPIGNYSSTFVNQSGGQMEISDGNNFVGYGVINSGETAIFSNLGAITFDQGGGVFNGSGSFINHGSINAEEALGVSNRNGEFHNYGSMCFTHGSGSRSISNDFDAIFTNHSGATIEIHHNLALGTSVGIENEDEAIFLNEGSILIDSTASNGIRNDRGRSVFINNGAIVATATDLLFHPNNVPASFRNTSQATLRGTGTMTLDNGLRNEYILSLGNAPGVLSIYGDFTQNTYSSRDSIKISGTMGGGNPSGHDSIYVSGDLDLEGGLIIDFAEGYVPVETDTFTVIEYGGALLSAFDWISFPLGVAGFRIDYTIPGKILIYRRPCSPATNQWIGGTGTWNNPTGWSLGHVPEYCEDVILSTGDSVTIPGLLDAVCRSLRIQGGSLVIEQGAELLIDVNEEAKIGLQCSSGGIVSNQGLMIISRTDGFNTAGISNSSGGEITNDGRIIVSDIKGGSSEGILNLSNFTNTMAGWISVFDVEQSYGLAHSISGSQFHNAGYIDIFGIGSDGVLVQSSAQFQNSGVMQVRDCTGSALSCRFGGEVVVSGSGQIYLQE